MSADAKDEFDIDVGAVNPDQFEEQIASGGIIPAGYYRATLNGAARTKSKGDPNASPPKPERAGWKLTFKVHGGPFDGKEVEDTLWAPGESQAMTTRVLLFKHRLGLVKRTADGKKFEAVPGKTDFMDCLDTPVIIHVKHEKYKREKDGSEGVAVRLDFNGLHLPDDPKAVEKVGKPGDPPPPDAGVTSPKPTSPPAAPANAKAKYDTSLL